MIELQNVWKSYGEGRKRQAVIAGVTLTLPQGRKIALLGSRGSGKSSLIRLMSRIEAPDKGAVRNSGLTCWPLDYFNFAERNATVHQNALTLGHMYGVDGREIGDIAVEISGVAVTRSKEFRRYGSGERRLLALGLTLALQFDWYFVDGGLPALPEERIDDIDAMIADRLSRASVVWATNDAAQVAGYCDAGLVLHRGKLRFYDTLAAASEAHLKAIDKEGSRRT